MSACSATSRSNLFDQTIFKVVPVKVWASSPSHCIYTHAFIHEGSGVNICSASLIRQLGIEVKDSDVELWTTNGVSWENKMAVEPMSIKGIVEDSSFEVKDALIVEDIVDVSWSIPRKELTEGYPYLQEINFPQLEGKKVDLLIGSDLHEAYIASDLNLGEPGQPYRIHSALGWTIYGKDVTSQRPASVMLNFIRQEHPPDVSCQQVLKALTGNFEDIGAPQEQCMSVEDKRALDIMGKTVKEVNGHLSLGLLWKDDKMDLEDNRPMALRRLEGLKRRFMADPDLFLKYRQKMVDYI